MKTKELAGNSDVSDHQTNDSFKYITFTSTCFGVMPVHVTKGAKATYHIVGLVITLLYMALCVSFCAHPFVIVTHSNEARERISDWIWKLDQVPYTSVLSNSTTVVILLIHTRKIAKMGKVMRHIDAVDEKLIKQDIITKQSLRTMKIKEIRYFLLLIFFCIVLILGSRIFLTYENHTDMTSKACIILQDFTRVCAFCVQLQFHALVMLVTNRFDLINKDMADSLHALPAYHIVEPQKYSYGPYRHHKAYTVPFRLSVLTQLHHLLMTACAKGNKLFQFQMLLDVVNTCVLLLVNLYAFMFQALYRELSLHDVFSIWPIHYTVKLVLFAYSGHVIKRSFYTTKGILAIAHISTKDVPAIIQDFILMEVEVYLMVLNNGKFSRVSLCRLIDVDLGILLKILNATCTYVLIMLQYKWNVF